MAPVKASRHPAPAERGMAGSDGGGASLPSPAGDRGEAAYRRLRGLIVSGRLAPGTRITEGEVVERFGMSRTPVRSALQRLRQEGFIQAIVSGRQSRLVVTPLTQEDVDELFGLVGELEGLAARRAAGLDPSARAELVQRLREHNGALRANASAVAPDPDRWLDFDFAFHGAYVAAAGGPRLRALHAGIVPQAERYARVYVTALTDRIVESADEHDRIVDALEAGMADAAQRATQVNWRNAAGRLSSIVARIGGLGTW